jgi:hypothetical protein
MFALRQKKENDSLQKAYWPIKEDGIITKIDCQTSQITFKKFIENNINSNSYHHS